MGYCKRSAVMLAAMLACPAAWSGPARQAGKPPSSARAAEETDCKPVLDRLCPAGTGGPVGLASGRDITALCR